MPFPHISACPPRRAGIFPNLYSARPTSTLPQGERCGLSRAVSRLRGLDGLPGRLPQHCFLCEPQVSSFPSHLLSCFSLLMVSRVGALSPGVPQAVLSVPPALFVPNVLGGWASRPARPSPSLWVIPCSALVGSRGCRARRARPLPGSLHLGRPLWTCCSQ